MWLFIRFILSTQFFLRKSSFHATTLRTYIFTIPVARNIKKPFWYSAAMTIILKHSDLYTKPHIRTPYLIEAKTPKREGQTGPIVLIKTQCALSLQINKISSEKKGNRMDKGKKRGKKLPKQPALTKRYHLSKTAASTPSQAKRRCVTPVAEKTSRFQYTQQVRVKRGKRRYSDETVCHYQQVEWPTIT